jgi:2-phosphoglycolate phosphatase
VTPPWVGKVRGVVFDLDGTLVDSYPAIAESVNRAREAHGLPALPEAHVRTRVGHGLESLIAELVGPAHVEEGVRLFREHYARAYASGTTALPDAAVVVQELQRRGYGLAIASNKPARFSEAILEALGLRAPFLEVQGPDRAGTTKPEPTMLALCRRALGTGPDETLYVGDMVLDVETARRAGVPVALVPGGSSSLPALRETGEPVLGSLRELLDLLPPRQPAPSPGRSAAAGLTGGPDRA